MADRRKRPTPVRRPIAVHGVATWNVDEYDDAPTTLDNDHPPDPADRVDYILVLFRTLRWVPVLTPRVLGKLWNLEPTTVESDAAKAHIFSKLDPLKREQRQAQSALALDRIAQLAMHTKSETTGLPDFGAAIRAIEMSAKFAGIRLDESPKEDADGPKQLRYEDLKAAVLERLRGELSAKKDEKP